MRGRGGGGDGLRSCTSIDVAWRAASSSNGPAATAATISDASKTIRLVVSRVSRRYCIVHVSELLRTRVAERPSAAARAVDMYM